MPAIPHPSSSAFAGSGVTIAKLSKPSLPTPKEESMTMWIAVTFARMLLQLA